MVIIDRQVWKVIPGNVFEITDKIYFLYQCKKKPTKTFFNCFPLSCSIQIGTILELCTQSKPEKQPLRSLTRHRNTSKWASPITIKENCTWYSIVSSQPPPPWKSNPGNSEGEALGKKAEKAGRNNTICARTLRFLSPLSFCIPHTVGNVQHHYRLNVIPWLPTQAE